MLYKVTNKGPARTVDFLGVFAEGQSQEFTEAQIEHYQDRLGVPAFASDLADENQFDVEVITEGEGK